MTKEKILQAKRALRGTHTDHFDDENTFCAKSDWDFNAAKLEHALLPNTGQTASVFGQEIDCEQRTRHLYGIYDCYV